MTPCAPVKPFRNAPTRGASAVPTCTRSGVCTDIPRSNNCIPVSTAAPTDTADRPSPRPTDRHTTDHERSDRACCARTVFRRRAAPSPGGRPSLLKPQSTCIPAPARVTWSCGDLRRRTSSNLHIRPPLPTRCRFNTSGQSQPCRPRRRILSQTRSSA